MTLTNFNADILLWRHADAQAINHENSEDLARPLSAKGQRQARIIAGWLKQYLAADAKILVSPALRATQTADALAREYQIDQHLAPETPLLTVINALELALQTPPHSGQILIVGHQPWLGSLAAQLLSADPADDKSISSVAIQKSAVWWLQRNKASDVPAFKLLTVQHPVFLKRKD